MFSKLENADMSSFIVLSQGAGRTQPNILANGIMNHDSHENKWPNTRIDVQILNLPEQKRTLL